MWAPNAESVSVVGDFNSWDGRLHPMRSMGASGLWELFVPEVGEGTRYKYEIRPRGGPPFLKADPMAFRTEVPPATASIVHDLKTYRWGDEAWLEKRKATRRRASPISIYEVHLGSWRRLPDEDNRSLTYRELAPQLADYVKHLGFTHVEFLPVAEHPFGGSWGYQVSSYYAPTARFGHPDDFRYLVDTLHQAGLGVIVDWVPGHFPRDAWALARFDGTALYEHADPRQGAHPDWGTLDLQLRAQRGAQLPRRQRAVLARPVPRRRAAGGRGGLDALPRLLAEARRVGAEPHGGRENEEAIGFLREVNDAVHQAYPDVMVIAEESTAWPQLAHRLTGGLGFTHKWNMGWMHDTLSYFQKDPIYRRFHHNQLTFGLLYQFSENFVLPLSHDEVVHGKKSLLSKMPGDEWQKFANLRALYGWMWAHPGKKLLFMGGEFGQWNEWNADSSLDWHLTDRAEEPPGDGARGAAQPALPGRGRALRDRRLAAGLPVDSGRLGRSERVRVRAARAQRVAGDRLRREPDAGGAPASTASASPAAGCGRRCSTPTRWPSAARASPTRPSRSSSRPWDGQPGSAAITLPPLAVVWFAPIDPPDVAKP